MKLLKSQLEDAKAEQERTGEELLRAEKKLDRLKCRSVKGVESQEAVVPGPGDVPAVAQAAKEVSFLFFLSGVGEAAAMGDVG